MSIGLKSAAFRPADNRKGASYFFGGAGAGAGLSPALRTGTGAAGAVAGVAAGGGTVRGTAGNAL
jgi:hypothetical protein